MANDNGKIGKRILIIFEDGQNRDGSMHVSSREGLCTSDTEFEIGVDSKDFIPRSRVIRVEVRE
jgi:hypothetical protein